MNNRKKTLILVLSLVLVCSMLFGLVACAQPEPAYAVFTFKTSADAEGQSFKIYMDDLEEGCTLADLFLTDTTEKYGFKVNMSYHETYKYGIIDIKGNKIDDLVPADKQWVSPMSTSNNEEDMMPGGEDFKVTINGVTYYPTNGISFVKIKEGVEYLFILQP